MRDEEWDDGAGGSEEFDEDEEWDEEDELEGERNAESQAVPPPELYDASRDDRDAAWVDRVRRGPTSDAILSCPLCFTTVCVDCQRHERDSSRFRAMFVMNCKIAPGSEHHISGSGTTGVRRSRKVMEAAHPPPLPSAERVECAHCGTELGMRDCEDGVYHFAGTLASQT
ncbi:hypothetical protein H632_c2668p1 [Helicosporidium sp. ATCC 50920]|nr:hypothetical protein H632_c2668p1 [Helicosporidium sp. ATCC 50920]|eukprot:KDD72979.1 hypothetical protein H632_c2668p1 [Helicosporidium sp. ATCC 50920]